MKKDISREEWEEEAKVLREEPKVLKTGKCLVAAGALVFIVGGVLKLLKLAIAGAILSLGLLVFLCGLCFIYGRKKRHDQWKKYLDVIGDNQDGVVSIDRIAAVTETPYNSVVADLEQMMRHGHFYRGRIDRDQRMLIWEP